MSFLHRTIGDRIGEGKASGNLGNTLKVLGRFDEAAVCCQRHLEISQEQGDKVRLRTYIWISKQTNTNTNMKTFWEKDSDSLRFFTVLKVGEARALYNMGNVFHAKGKQQLWGCTQEPGDLPPDVRDTLQRATGFYEYVCFMPV